MKLWWHTEKKTINTHQYLIGTITENKSDLIMMNLSLTNCVGAEATNAFAPCTPLPLWEQLNSTTGAARQVIKHLHRADFGQNVIADVREA